MRNRDLLIPLFFIVGVAKVVFTALNYEFGNSTWRYEGIFSDGMDPLSIESSTSDKIKDIDINSGYGFNDIV